MKNSNERIREGIRISGLCLYIEKAKTLVCADLHLGYEEMMNKEGILIPRFNFAEIKKALTAALNETKPEKIAINGDLKHEFGRISEQEWKEAIEMLKFLKSKSKELIIVRGNHDTALGPLAGWEGVKARDELYIPEEKILIIHGHQEKGKIKKSPAFRDAEIIIIAHDHPAITLREGAKAETYKCFLHGRWQGKEIIAMPSMNALTAGTDIRREKMLSPMLQGPLGDFEAWVVEDKPYYFGKLKDIKA